MAFENQKLSFAIHSSLHRIWELREILKIAIWFTAISNSQIIAEFKLEFLTSLVALPKFLDPVLTVEIMIWSDRLDSLLTYYGEGWHIVEPILFAGLF